MQSNNILLAHSPAAQRNQDHILAQLQALLPTAGLALEIASGTGQHAAHFAAALPGWRWQPTDLHGDRFASITGWALQSGAHNVQHPLRLDVLGNTWPTDGPLLDAAFDLIYCANMLHIAPWTCCAGLMQGAARHLAPSGQLITYGPYLEDSVPTSPGNLSFDASLRAEDASWGIRHMNDVAAVAASAGLVLKQRIPMPANNLLLVWVRALPSH